MNGHLKKIMNNAWIDWHDGISPKDIPFPESCNPSFRRGFEAACEELLPMLKEATVAVESQAGEIDLINSMLGETGGNGYDTLAKRIKAAIKED